MVGGQLVFALVILVALWSLPVRAADAQPQTQIIAPQQWRSWDEVAADPRFKALPSDQSPPHGSLISVDYPLLLTEWVGVVVISGLLWLFLRSK
jgi:hypothetical protein